MTQIKVRVPDADYHRDLISCQVACPVHTDARGYVRAIAEGDFEKAYLIARGPNPFASICGRICGAPCEAACRRGKIPQVDDDGRFVSNDRPIAIRALKRFACEQAGPEAVSPDSLLEQFVDFDPPVAARSEEMAALLHSAVAGNFKKAEGEKIAIIGAGPAGLSAAHDLALMGFRPFVYETEPVAAGMLAVGVPAYRLPRDLIEKEIDVIRALGVEIKCGVTVGSDISFADLREDHSAVILGVGAKSSRSLGLPGENGPDVFGGVDILRSVSLGEPLELGERIVVVGGGNVAYDVARTVVRQIAFDSARTAARLTKTSSVTLVSLESAEEMPADTIEIVEGDEEGVDRLNGWGPVSIDRDGLGKLVSVTFRRCLSVYDEDRKFSPVYDDSDVVRLDCDTVLLAVGQSPKIDFLSEGGEDIKTGRGWPEVDPETLGTSAPDVFVAGDLAHGTRLLIDAVASGKKAARSVYRFVTGREIEEHEVTAHITLEGYKRERGYESIRRVPVPVADPGARLDEPGLEVETGFTRDMAVTEASRCLDCGVTPVFDGLRCVLCGGCVDVCPTECLKLVSLSSLAEAPDLTAAITNSIGEDEALNENSAILKDEDRCIRCALCAMRCPVDAISMERVTISTHWRSL
ncbi:MAG: 4Fe-4S dicluster domain-containing protein [Acidobacteria bacterium]|nr:MAG: 4Fe-4S dicluster domain-containing protein [Acidobacteriota bacterium]REJ99013.1 MAG: 4Fe-4S dicluster domain-containing protein [Acidobacteriota bacterium]REK16266.1 MAG: 4Fe-4S dicluster domain-containing protein [Acidobacteriota bacterium]REK43947.1 MAG: 4Fe-4S dicluster domain-containing protein [Acidobacteriota bacterium]